MIHDIAIYILIFALGMLAGYLLKVVMVNRERMGAKGSGTFVP
jgi:hypothetical protein